MTYLLATLIVALLGLRVLESRWRDETVRLADASWRQMVSELVSEQRAEVAGLLQRIQAPERAVVAHEVQSMAEVEMPQPPLSDEDWKTYSDTQAAIERLEAMENAPFDRV